MNLLRVQKSELDSYLIRSELLESRVYSDEIESDKAYIDIDKSWDGIIFLLTGSASQDADHQLLKIFFSNQLVDENQDLGYGPAHYLNQDQVKKIYSQIEGIGISELESKFNPELMNQKNVYPEIWDENEGLGYLIENYMELREFFYLANRNEEAVITILG